MVGYPEVIWIGTCGSVPTSRLAGSDPFVDRSTLRAIALTLPALPSCSRDEGRKYTVAGKGKTELRARLLTGWKANRLNQSSGISLPV
jgi:hypothetical protein